MNVLAKLFFFSDNWSAKPMLCLCAPEYGFEVPGSLKNALDWTLYSADFSYKPLALITTSSSVKKAHNALQPIFTALDAKISEGGSLLIRLVRSKLDASGKLSDAATMIQIRAVVKASLGFHHG